MVRLARRSFHNSIGDAPHHLVEQWIATPATDDSRRLALSGDSDSLDWNSVQVPGEWRSNDAFADHAGGVLYRTTFDHVMPTTDQRLWITCDGIFDQADIWLDGAYIGDQDDYFLRHAYDVTALSRLDTTHSLIVEVNGSHHAGIWRPIELVTTGLVGIETTRILCRDATDAQAHLRLHAVLDSSVSCMTTVRTSVNDVVLSQKNHSLSPGSNEIAWTIDIDQPALWFPWGLGDQPLCTVLIEVLIDGVISDSYTVLTGLREVSMADWVLHVNGERMYTKGAYLEMPDCDMGAVSDQDIAHPIVLAHELGLNLVRMHDHVAHPAIYETADALGMMIWQDIPHRPTGKRGRRVAARWADGLVATLGHHPSVALWHHKAFDKWTQSHLRKVDVTRPIVAHASTAVPLGLFNHERAKPVRQFLSGIGHDLTTSIAVIPNIARFPTHEQWHVVHVDAHEAVTDPVSIRRDIEALRRVKYSPAGGFCYPGLLDSSTLSDGGVLDSAASPKPSYFALQDACRPVIVVADQLPSVLQPGDVISFDVHVVSDVHHELVDARVIATLTWSGGQQHHEWTGDIARDACVFIGHVDSVTPTTVGSLILSLLVEAGEHTSSNRYVYTIVA